MIEFQRLAHQVLAIIQHARLRNQRLIHDEHVAVAVRLQTLDRAAHEIRERGLCDGEFALLGKIQRTFRKDPEQRSLAVRRRAFEVCARADHLPPRRVQAREQILPILAPPAFSLGQKVLAAAAEQHLESRRGEQHRRERLAVLGIPRVRVKCRGRRRGETAIRHEPDRAAFLAREFEDGRNRSAALIHSCRVVPRLLPRRQRARGGCGIGNGELQRVVAHERGVWEHALSVWEHALHFETIARAIAEQPRRREVPRDEPVAHENDDPVRTLHDPEPHVQHADSEEAEQDRESEQIIPKPHVGADSTSRARRMQMRSAEWGMPLRVSAQCSVLSECASKGWPLY